MTEIILPYNALSSKLIYKISKQFKTTGNLLSTFFPKLGENIVQAKIQVTPKEYCAIAYTSAIANTLLLIFILDAIALATGMLMLGLYSLVFGLVFALASFYTTITYPKIVAL